ncbi:MBL fold metallo-hydrolase [Actinocrinis puniceicyclus]|uniref:MBL fold metallo-hydrolase n=1 Tax=Actinocrinis puniceicyclus TaxID=977794 RepID=A0A8J7WK24_9ACTN|nr:MBL fold metallo-hydrolase [Actinocrinis puniceicyclus]MBS2961587.1 MBL fold metallo-hydrolase [Actinocrinis puniceicyclus]
MTDRDWEQLADGVFRKRFDPCDVTVTAVIGSDGVAVVDTRCSPEEGREIREQLSGFTRAPVRWVVNTHAHYDHCWGNVEFTEARLSPPARIWAHASVPARLDPDDPQLRALAARLGGQGPDWARRMARLELAAPTELVRDGARIELGDRSLDLRFLGRGHTDGDLWIFVGPAAGSSAPGSSAPDGASPCADVVLAGDLVEQSGPPVFGDDSFPLEWAETLDRALPMIGRDALVIPGHGAVVDAAFVRRQRETIGAVAAEIRRLYAAGVAVESAVAQGTWVVEPADLHCAIERGYAALDAGA